MSARNKAIIEKANEAFRNNDIEGLLALCTEDFSWTMVGGPTASGKTGLSLDLATLLAEQGRRLPLTRQFGELALTATDADRLGRSGVEGGGADTGNQGVVVDEDHHPGFGAVGLGEHVGVDWPSCP